MAAVHFWVIQFATLLVSLSFVSSDAESSSEDVVTEYTILQQLDHFDNDNNNTFGMRYFLRNDLWESDGPVYIYIGEEYSADLLKDYLTGGLMLDLATETYGVMYLLEHRYYGNSKISKDLEETRYQYLSIKQVLADVAHFIRKIKEVSAITESKIVVFGGSYGGRLATWMRMKYPELVDAAVASSAPLKNTLEFPEYYDQVADAYREYGGYRCLRAIQNKIKHERSLLAHDSGEVNLKKEENFCPEVEIHSTSQKNMFGTLALNHITHPVINFNFGEILSKCEDILSPIHVSNSKGCYSFDFDITGWSESPYDYLRCTELAQFPTSTVTSDLPFDIPLQMYNDRCVKVYGDSYDGKFIRRAISQMDEEYGGVTPNVTKVVFVNGGLDPWHHLGVLKDLSSEAPAIFMRNSTHCQDLSPYEPTDSLELKDTRLRIKELIKDWIGYRVHLPTRTWTFFKPPSTWDRVAK